MAFDEDIMTRLEQYKENRDSTLEIISQAFKRADKILSENKREELSVLMITGAFIEAMYAAGEYGLNEIKDSVSMKKIQALYAQQQESLSYLINLLETNGSEENDIKEKLQIILPHLKASGSAIQAFKSCHQLITELRKQIISVY